MTPAELHREAHAGKEREIVNTVAWTFDNRVYDGARDFIAALEAEGLYMIPAERLEALLRAEEAGKR